MKTTDDDEKERGFYPWNRAILWLIILFGLIFIAMIELDLSAQFWLVGFIIVFLLVAERFCQKGIPRIFYLGIVGFLSLRYIVWRTTSTLSFDFNIDTLVMILLYLAELYAVVLSMLGLFVCLEPISRAKAPIPSNPDLLPTVDVFVPTYNEPIEILEVTLVAAVQIRYPNSKLKVHLLDDGGTREKISHIDPEKSDAAMRRASELKSLCKRVGAIYRTRENNDDHKAGNINAALKRTNNDLIVILDSDHVPTVDFLDSTVGYFAKDPKLALVQSPHFFINADPIEKNLETFAKMPSENEMFYRLMQRGLDYWNSALFAGSAAVIRRSHIEDIGGFATETITEDAETGLALHGRGYKTAYIAKPLISGMAPEDFESFIIQRSRWGMGMLQMMLLKNPLTYPGLSFSQRLSYLTMCLYWFFPFARVIFLMAPIFFLVFGMEIYHANTMEFFAFTVPHFFASMRLSSFMYSKVRWPYIAAIYETLQSLFSLRAIIKVLRNPRSPVFEVTPKGKQIDKEYVSPLATPFYIIFWLLVLSAFIGLYRLYISQEEWHITAIVLFWHFINFLILLACMGALVELRQRRNAPRVPTDLEAKLTVNDVDITCKITDVSIGGAALTLRLDEDELPKVNAVNSGQLRVYNEALHRFSIFQVDIMSSRNADDDQYLVGVKLVPSDERQFAETVAFVHGDSKRWQDVWNNRPEPVGGIRGGILLAWWGIMHIEHHYQQLLSGVISRAKRRKFWNKGMPHDDKKESAGTQDWVKVKSEI